MFRNPRIILLIIIILSFGALIINVPKTPLKLNLGPLKLDTVIEKPRIDLNFFGVEIKRDLDMKLGLDLQGGTSITLQADVESIPAEERNKALEAVKEVLERRVNFFGVSEPVVQTSRTQEEQFRIIVELPGVTDLDQARNLVGQTAKLEFREFKDSNPPPGSLPTLENTKPSGISGKDIESANVDFQPGQSAQDANQPVVRFELKKESAEKFRELTKRLIGKPLVIFLDDSAVSAPIVQSEIGEEGIITGVSSEEAKKLAIQLSAGALPVESIEIISERTIGPTLGKISINQSLIAATIGLLTLIIFMIAYYRFLGILAGVALVLYALFVLAVFRLIPITLTLAGIAGFILSIGMAVDANILIFERMKEEIRAGRNNVQSIEIGFSRAWSSIRDSNISSLITSAILFWFGSGAVRGFAVALAIGIVISMLTAIFVTRNFLRVFYRG